MLWSFDDHVIKFYVQRSRDPNIDPNIDLDSSFAFNQTFNIFHPKILRISSSVSDFPCHRYKQLVVATLYQLGHNLLYINTSSFWKKSLICFTQPRSSSLLDSRLARKNYLQISAFSVRWWWSKRRSINKSHWKSHK